MMGNMVNLTKTPDDMMIRAIQKYFHGKKWNNTKIYGVLVSYDDGGESPDLEINVEIADVLNTICDNYDNVDVFGYVWGELIRIYDITLPTVNINKPCTSSTTNEYCRADDCPAYNYCDGTLPHKPTVDITKRYLPCNKIGCAYNRTTTFNGVPVKPQCSISYMTPTHIGCLNT